jgi:hypothetical protein
MKTRHNKQNHERTRIHPQPASSAEAMFFYLYFSVISFMLSAAFAEKQ